MSQSTMPQTAAAAAASPCMLDMLPDEVVVKCLMRLDCACARAAVARFACASRRAHRLVVASSSIWARLLALSLVAPLDIAANAEAIAATRLRINAIDDPRSALRCWLQLECWSWEHFKCDLQPHPAADESGQQAQPSPHFLQRFLQRAALVVPAVLHNDDASPQSTAPSPRGNGYRSCAGSRGGLALSDAVPVLFGGSSADPRADGHSRYYNDAWQLRDGSCEQTGCVKHIIPLPTMQDMAPAARTAATLTAVPGAFGKLLLFGGHAAASHTSPGGFANDLWEGSVVADPITHCVQSVEWRYIGSGQEAAQEQRAWPEARQGHSATVQHGRILIFGGSYPAATLNDSWILDPCAAQFEPYSMAVPGSSTPPVYISRVHESFRTTYLWFRVIPEGAVPEPRAGHAAVAIDPARMLVFGGNTSAATMQPELWCLELSIIHTSGDHTMPSQAGRWSLIEVIGQRPAARIGHSATAVGTRVLIFGGRNLFHSDDADDFDLRERHGAGEGLVHVLETACQPMRWRTVRPTGSPPQLRTGHCALPGTARGCYGLTVLGGLNPDSNAVLSCEDAYALRIFGPSA